MGISSCKRDLFSIFNLLIKYFQFRLAKDDYSCVMKVLLENFTENIRDQIPETDQIEQYHYRQEEQEQEEEALRNAVIKIQQGLKICLFK